MEKRRVQRTGGSSFSITLPKKWIEKNGVKEQDSVVLFPASGGPLVIHTQASLEKNAMRELDAVGLDSEELKREIIALYILGVDEIAIHTAALTRHHRLEIQKTLQLLIGFEIVEESNGKMLIKNIFSAQKFSFKQSLENMFSMVQAMFRDSANALLSSDTDLAQDVQKRDLSVDKLYFLILRYNQILLQGRVMEEEFGLRFGQSYYYENVALQLERIADHAVKIAHIAEMNKMKMSAEFKKTLQDNVARLLKVLDRLSLIIKNDSEKLEIHQSIKEIEKAEKTAISLQKEAARSNFSEALVISDSINRFQGYLLNIAELALDQNLAA